MCNLEAFVAERIKIYPGIRLIQNKKEMIAQINGAGGFSVGSTLILIFQLQAFCFVAAGLISRVRSDSGQWRFGSCRPREWYCKGPCRRSGGLPVNWAKCFVVWVLTTGRQVREPHMLDRYGVSYQTPRTWLRVSLVIFYWERLDREYEGYSVYLEGSCRLSSGWW